MTPLVARRLPLVLGNRPGLDRGRLVLGDGLGGGVRLGVRTITVTVGALISGPPRRCIPVARVLPRTAPLPTG